MTARIFDEAVQAYREAQLELLKPLGYEVLAKMPRTKRINAPSEFDGLEFRIERRAGDSGGVRIEVRACSRHLLIFLSCSSSGFEMLSDGSIVKEVGIPLDD